MVRVTNLIGATKNVVLGTPTIAEEFATNVVISIPRKNNFCMQRIVELDCHLVINVIVKLNTSYVQIA
jgi:hypothetical protein